MAYSADEITDVAAYLEHYGILGMKWGRRRNRKQLQAARGVKPWEEEGESDTKETEKPSADRVRASKLSKRKVHTMTNDELRDYTTRLQLENQLIEAQQRYRNLTSPQQKQAKQHKGREFVMGIASNVARQLATDYLKNAAQVAIDERLSKNPNTAKYVPNRKKKDQNKD